MWTWLHSLIAWRWQQGSTMEEPSYEEDSWWLTRCRKIYEQQNKCGKMLAGKGQVCIDAESNCQSLRVYHELKEQHYFFNSRYQLQMWNIYSTYTKVMMLKKQICIPTCPFSTYTHHKDFCANSWEEEKVIYQFNSSIFLTFCGSCYISHHLCSQLLSMQYTVTYSFNHSHSTQYNYKQGKIKEHQEQKTWSIKNKCCTTSKSLPLPMFSFASH